jgi:Derlin-2/3
MGAFDTGGRGGTADYITAWVFGMVCILMTHVWIYPLFPIFTTNMVDYVLYIWSRRHPMMNVDLWGIPMKSVYLPFGYLALNVAIGSNVSPIIEGMVIGHIYYYLVDVVPRLYGTRVIRTPQILIDLLGAGEYR